MVTHGHLITAWNKVILKKLLIPQLVKQVPACYWTWIHYSAHKRPTLHISPAIWIQPTPSYLVYLGTILIHPSIHRSSTFFCSSTLSSSSFMFLQASIICPTLRWKYSLQLPAPSHPSLLFPQYQILSCIPMLNNRQNYGFVCFNLNNSKHSLNVIYL